MILDTTGCTKLIAKEYLGTSIVTSGRLYIIVRWNANMVHQTELPR